MKALAPLNFNFHGYDYERGITVLSEGLSAASEALEDKRASAETAWKIYEDGVMSGELAEEEERDEETGSLLWSKSLAFEYDIKLIDEGIGALRKAFVVALYHHWERIVFQWTEAPIGSDHKKLVGRVRARGVELPEQFEHIYLLNNILKHNSAKAGPLLLKTWPDLFWRPDKLAMRVAKGDKRILWESAIILGDHMMDCIILTMKASGPVSHRP